LHLKPLDGWPEMPEVHEPNFKWHFESTRVAGRDFDLAVASDPDGMLIEACERQDAGEKGVIDPFWATTWRAAAGLDEYMSRLPMIGMRVLELGCGTGHAGIAAALRGADVTLSDGVEDPLILVRKSVAALPRPVRVIRLRFGVDTIENEQFPLIIGSDVTYLRELWPQLDACLRTHLHRDGQVLLSDPFRQIATEFRDYIQTKPWKYQEHSITLDDDPAHPIRIMQLSYN
jgi:predicted nicotinamide N-methyase